MCLEPRKNKNTPYRTKNPLRYKSLVINNGKICSLYVQSFRWKLGEWRTAEFRKRSGVNDYYDVSPEEHDHGFHVYTNRLPVIDPERNCFGVFEVRDFIASGEFGDFKCETYKKARLVALYTSNWEVFELTKSISGFKGPKTLKPKSTSRW